jgi:hypothetical protein
MITRLWWQIRLAVNVVHILLQALIIKLPIMGNLGWILLILSQVILVLTIKKPSSPTPLEKPSISITNTTPEWFNKSFFVDKPTFRPEQNIEAVTAHWEKLRQLQPAHRDVLVNLSLISWYQGDTEQSAWWWQQAQATDPTLVFLNK